MILSCESFKSVQGVKTVMLAHGPSFNITFNITDSEILGFLAFLPFSLPEITTSHTIHCCTVVRSGRKTTNMQLTHLHRHSIRKKDC